MGQGRHYTQRPHQGEPGLRTHLKASRGILGPKREAEKQANLFAIDYTAHVFLARNLGATAPVQRVLGEEQWSLNEPRLECLVGSFHKGAHSGDSNTLAGAHRVRGSLEAGQTQRKPCRQWEPG